MAITANELSINNILSLCGEPINISSGFIADYDFSLKNNFSDNTPIRKGDVEPIPITEEWLLKLGFINDDAQRYFKNGIYLILYDEGCTILHNQIHINYFYVHQLQNLYFALTGKELTYGNNPN